MWLFETSQMVIAEYYTLILPVITESKLGAEHVVLFTFSTAML